MQQDGMLLLLVEDEALARISLAEELRAVGLTVIEAVNADEAWEYLQAGCEIDIIFSDIEMPGSMDGLQFALRVRECYPLLPIILASGNCGPDVSEEIVKFLPKPFALEDAIQLVVAGLQLQPHRGRRGGTLS
jgi:CheY-like chemotaxis protein